MKTILIAVILILFQINLHSQGWPPYWEANGWALRTIISSNFDSTEVRTEIQDSTASNGLYSQSFNANGVHLTLGQLIKFSVEWFKEFPETTVPGHFLLDYNIQEISNNITELFFEFTYRGSVSSVSQYSSLALNQGEWQSMTIDTLTSLSSFRYLHLTFVNVRSDSAQEVSYKILVDNLRLVYADTTIILDSFGDSLTVGFREDNISDQQSSFHLDQNYPNPFNPSTKIEYQISQPGFVSLKVYDILGKKVATLVNEEKPVGSYEVEFDGSELSSGVYFYLLKSNSHTQIRKMLLIK